MRHTQTPRPPVSTLLTMLAMLVPNLAVGQVRRGPEFQVNSYTTSFQRFSSTASDDTGTFIVVWESFHRTAAPMAFSEECMIEPAPPPLLASSRSTRTHTVINNSPE